MARILKDDINARMDQIAMTAGIGVDISKWIDLSRLDREQLPAWIDLLSEAERDVRRLRG